MAEVRVSNPSRQKREEMVMTLAVPGGWEIINPRVTDQTFDSGFQRQVCDGGSNAVLDLGVGLQGIKFVAAASRRDHLGTAG